uniref:Amphipathic peptide StCT2 n=1 Tax=Scorpiops tibetanus TaxID=500600 RepID=NDB4F_SCOTI|nr:RecName: Full=Amphipathic peptide CT2; Short=StCT2; AltName: Full=Non-disulfide-bridged peptide 4.15; Short=NDBP-4.15; AltName: Full=Non-disulfide-bridged peptide 5.17; Short=NDBP-5.17; Flags: Precursor [Scorpiops tibetanus]
MKTQFAVLIISMILMQMLVQTEAGFWGKLWEGVKSAIGKRSLRNQDQFDNMFDSDLSDADLKLLDDLFD